jgi:hypothetical protein
MLGVPILWARLVLPKLPRDITEILDRIRAEPEQALHLERDATAKAAELARTNS